MRYSIGMYRYVTLFPKYLISLGLTIPYITYLLIDLSTFFW